MNQISQISSEMSAALALDLAADLWPEGVVFGNHGIDPVYGAALLQKDWFRQMVDEAKREWSSITNAKQRIKLKSQIVVEMSLNELYNIVTDANVPAAARVSAFKELKDISGTAAADPNQGGPAAPMVNIYLGGADAPSISIQGTGVTAPQEPEYEDALEGFANEVTSSNLEIEGMAPL